MAGVEGVRGQVEVNLSERVAVCVNGHAVYDAFRRRIHSGSHFTIVVSGPANWSVYLLLDNDSHVPTFQERGGVDSFRFVFSAHVLRRIVRCL